MSLVSWVFFLVLVQPSFAASITAASSHGNLSSFTGTTAAPSGCCGIEPYFVGFNFWLNQSLTVTYATVITQYLKYNNTIIPKTTTIYDSPHINSLVWTGSAPIPENLLYGETVFETATEITVPGATFTSPTKYGAIGVAKYMTGTTTGTTCLPREDEFFTMINLPTDFVWVPTSSWMAGDMLWFNQPDTSFRNAILAIPSITQTFPSISSCSVILGSGQPSVHIPISALTAHDSTTIIMTGAFIDTIAISTPQVSPSPAFSSQASVPTPSSQASVPTAARSSYQTSAEAQSKPSSTPYTPSSKQISAVDVITNPVRASSINVGSSVVSTSFAASSAGIVLPDGGTLAPGSKTTINGVQVSYAASASAIVIGGSTVRLPGPNKTPMVNIPIGPSTLKAIVLTGPGGGIILPNGGTLLPDSTTVYEGETIALAPSETAVVIDSSTINVVVATPASASALAPATAIIVLNSSTFPISYVTASGGGVILPNGGTLLPGSKTVWNGDTIALASSETAIVVAGSTIPLTPPAVTKTTNGGVGGYIVSGLGGGGGTVITSSLGSSQTAGSKGPLATGAGGRISDLRPATALVVIMVMCLIGVGI